MLAGLLLLAGCASAPPAPNTDPNTDPATAPVAAQAPSAETAPDAASAPARAPTSAPASTEPDDEASVGWTLEISAPEAVRPLLDRYLDLSRFQRSEGNRSILRSELLRLLSAAPAQARKLLETQGYFEAQVSAELPPGALDEGPRNLPVPVLLKVLPGPLTRVNELQLEIHGPLGDAVEAGDPAAVALATQLRQQWSLDRGEAFTQSRWDDAKSSALNLLHTEGYPAASWMRTQARVQPAERQANLLLTLESGPMFRIGELRVEGLDHVRRDAVTALRNFSRGTPLRERVLLDFQDRLVKSNLFDGVSVTYDPDPAQAADTPITVRLRERMLQQATVGVGISDASGPRITLEHLHQNPLRLGWQSKTKWQLGQTAKSLSVDLTSHPHPGPYRNLLSGSITETEASGLRVTSEKARLGRTQDTERIERTYYIELQRAFTRQLSDSSITDDASAASLNYQWVWRDLDHPILPTRGWGVSADAAVGHSYATNNSSGWFGRSTVRVTGYWTPGQNWYGQARLEAGQVFAKTAVSVPYTLLFRAGGDDSVRGYSYQSLGPSDGNGTAVGGRFLATGSLEMARPFSLAHPAWWGAVFVDAGNAAEDLGRWEAARGYGVGVRWRGPVGPLRIDLAYGERTNRMRLHFTVGLTF